MKKKPPLMEVFFIFCMVEIVKCTESANLLDILLSENKGGLIK
jgi:hypothetical protein